MNIENKSRKAFLAVTLLTVLSIVSVITVYAVLIGTFQGPGEVTVGGTGTGSVMYTADNVTWAASLSRGTGAAWFSRLEIVAGGYSGPVTLTWQLQEKNGTDIWLNVTGTTTTNVVLSSSSTQIVYATSDGAPGDSNYNWGLSLTAAGTYRVRVYVESA